MDRLAHRILIVVVLFVLAVAGILVAKSRTVRSDALGPRPSGADMSLKELTLQEESVGGSRWQLVADQASVFDQEGRTALRKVIVHVNDRDRAWTIVGDEGDFFKQTKNLELRRNVVMTSNDGLQLETSVLRWQDAERRLWTDAPVRIRRQGTIINGTALDVRMSEDATTVKGPVRATFRRGQGH